MNLTEIGGLGGLRGRSLGLSLERQVRKRERVLQREVGEYASFWRYASVGSHPKWLQKRKGKPAGSPAASSLLTSGILLSTPFSLDQPPYLKFLPVLSSSQPYHPSLSRGPLLTVPGHGSPRLASGTTFLPHSTLPLALALCNQWCLSSRTARKLIYSDFPGGPSG